MKWIEMTVFTTEQGLDAVVARFDMLGIQQVIIEQGKESIEAFLKETAKYWDYADTDELVAGEEPCVKAYLADAGENMELVHQAEASFDALRNMDVGLDLGSLRFVVRVTDEEDWANNWKKYFKPKYKDYIDIAHSHGKKIFMHSDGYTLDIYPELIELGLDAFNSQIFCIGPEDLEQFKGKITFWGEIDRQNLLPYGTEEEIRQAVRKVYNHLWDNGGCIAQMEFGAGAKPENVYAAFDEWDKLTRK